MLVLVVESKLLNEEIIDHGIDIEILICCLIVSGLDISLDIFHLLLYGVEDFTVLRNFILEHHRQAAASAESVHLIHPVIELEQIAAVGNGRIGIAAVHHILVAFAYIDTVCIDLDFLAEIIVADMASVDDQLDIKAARVPAQAIREGCRCPVGNVLGHGIAQHGTVHPVGQQFPTLVGRQALRPDLLVELKGKRQLREILGGISAQAETQLGIFYIHSAVGIVEGKTVIAAPVLFLAADLESGFLPVASSFAFLFKNDYRQTCIGHFDGIDNALLPVGNDIFDR